MHRNTFLLVVLLAVFAALVVGVNIGKKVAPAPTPTPAPSTTPAPLSQLLQYSGCGILLEYPAALTLMDSASGSALLVDKTQPDQSIVVACQKEIPRPTLAPENIETLTLSSASAKLYHEEKLDSLFFRHPKTGLDVFIAGFGETFNTVIKTIKLLP